MVKTVGVLGLQGDFEAHRDALSDVGVEPVIVRWPEQLQEVDGLVIPGGESTTLIRLMRGSGFLRPLERFHESGKAVYGTCAGAILLARRVLAPEQFSLGLIDITIRRNAFGRQRESFETEEGRAEPSIIPELGGGPLELVFIRAPRIVSCGQGVDILIRSGDEPVLVRQGFVLAGTFHPELTSGREIHGYFADMVRVQSASPGGRPRGSSARVRARDPVS